MGWVARSGICSGNMIPGKAEEEHKEPVLPEDIRAGIFHGISCFIRTHQNVFGFIRIPMDETKTTLFILLEAPRTMTPDTELCFTISLQRSGLRTVALMESDRQDSEVCGNLGEITDISVLDGVLLEIHGSRGVLRMSLPDHYLKLFEQHSTDTQQR